jgi:uncharacterized protein YkvS
LKLTAKEGDHIRFNRKGFSITGEVIKVKDTSVLVSINDHDAENLKIDTPLTIVSHHHYSIV